MSIIALLYCLLLIVVSAIGLTWYGRLTVPFKILTFSVLAVLLINVLSAIYSSKYKNNAPILQAESIIEYLFYSATYYYLFKSKMIRMAIIGSMILVTIFFFINALFLQPFHKVFPTNIYLPTQVLYVIFSLLLFKQMLLYPVNINIVKQSVFWYNTAMLFYATTMFLTLGLTNYYSAHKINDYAIYYFWYFSSFIFHILIGVSLLAYNRKINTAHAR
ncbi:MAG: hypothetical protein JWP94_1766 [Mucilaginibacter sp.]|jgi:hypothetical protein|nr:hypothetical protein [Mucilaginibacter sp.]